MTDDAATGEDAHGARQVAHFYSAIGDAYKRLWAPELLKMSGALLDELPLQRAARVLYAGAGVGALLPEIAARAPDAVVAGVDIAHGMLCLAPRRFPRVVMDVTRLGFRAESFDVGVLSFVLFHLPEPLTGLQEMARLLRSGGAIGTITWGNDPTYPAYELWTEELDRHGAPPADQSISRHDLVDTPGKVEALLQRAGFHSIRTFTGIYENVMTPDSFIEHRTGHGASKRRFESLQPDVQTACTAAVRTRLEALDAGGLVDRSDVVYAHAGKP
ncbi:MAG: class I SAM-dependent methyltransferase [Actinomycetota bacterium]